MSKKLKQYYCTSCGSVSPKWSGKCESCGEWNSMQENEIEKHKYAKTIAVDFSNKSSKSLVINSLNEKLENFPKTQLGSNELNRVICGGLVPGSVTLIGGDPGIGKSTLLLQEACLFARAKAKTKASATTQEQDQTQTHDAITNIITKEKPNVYYASGEESAQQIQQRARRLGLADDPLLLMAESNIDTILSNIQPAQTALLIIDSVQTVWTDHVESTPGTVTQIRAVTQKLIHFAKKNHVPVIIVGHVTKDGHIAGPKILEHMVDTVLYFEGDQHHQFRLLRAVKNRFGPAQEIGVFEMMESGLIDVDNPSECFMDASIHQDASGSVVFPGMEGSRPILVDVQALVGPTSYSQPRRAVVGWNLHRLAMILAILETKCGLKAASRDVYLNITGGLKIQEPAVDLAVAAAIISSYFDKALPRDCGFFGEVGLSGEIRSVAHMDGRISECSKLGITQIICPKPSKRARKSQKQLAAGKNAMQKNTTIHEINHLDHLVSFIRQYG